MKPLLLAHNLLLMSPLIKINCYTFIKPQIPKISTDSGPPIKYQPGVLIRGYQMCPNWFNFGHTVIEPPY